MNEMIERVAKAILHAIDSSQHNFGDEGIKLTMEDAARSAIEAMRPPTGDMIDAGAATAGLPPAFELHLCDVRPDIADIIIGILDGYPSKIWRAMIDAALRG